MKQGFFFKQNTHGVGNRGGVVAVALMIAGVWCGGEMVYGRGVEVRRD